MEVRQRGLIAGFLTAARTLWRNSPSPQWTGTLKRSY